MDKKNLEAIYPLSPLQKGILFDSLYAPETLSYFVQIHFNLQQIKLEWLQQAWQQVQQRHPVLRTLFVWENQKQPLQVVLKQTKMDWRVENWQQYHEKTQQDKIADLLQKDRAEGFNLNKAPLMRFYIIKLDEDKCHFIWSHHHIILDGWLCPIILQEVFATYQAIVKNQSVSLPTLRPFKDYIHWIQQQNITQAKTYWTQALHGVIAPTPLSINRITEDIPLYKEHHTDFSEVIKYKLQNFSRKKGITLNTIVQATWALTLSCYSRQQDVLFGGMVSGRPATLQKVESMVGLFANTLPVRIKIEPQKQMIDWLQQLQAQQAEREEYSYQSLVELQQWSQIPAGTALFDSVVVTENFPIDAALTDHSQALKITDFHFSEHANSALILVFSLYQDRFSIRTIFDQNQFNISDIHRLIEHLEMALTHLFESPLVSQPILLTEQEKNQLAAWNQTNKNYPHACLHQLIERQVKATPLAIAATYQAQSFTYQQLNQKANQLAHYLRDNGVKTKDFVGIYIDRSLDIIVGLLGILKAGAAYVPLDPTYPAERIAFMLQDAQPPILLTQQHLLPTLPETQARILCLDQDWDDIAKKSEKNPNIPVQLNQLAYMIYTSGSTGKPKGAMNSHLAISNRLLWMQDQYQLTDKDSILQKTPFSFDVSVWEFFLPLLAGAKLVFAKPKGHKEATYLVDLIQQAQITTLHFVPSMLQLFLQADKVSDCGSLRQVFCSGEALPVNLQNTFFNRLPKVALHNLYGPTEAAVDVTFWQCQANETRHTVPIGQPISNIQIHILDTQLRPVPIGIAGELHIAGIGVARGYHQRPELTAEKFIDNPLSQPETLVISNPEQTAETIQIKTENKLYKTGDLARWLPDGQIEYLGRIDHQVKIRGLRIELGEIEAAIAHSAYVNETVVLVQEGQDIDDKQLIAFIVPKKQQDAKQESAYVEQVAEIYHHTYGDADEATDFNIAGWNSSYTGQAIPDVEMQEWVEHTVKRILALKPQKIVEIGCGTGLLLSRIAPTCESDLGLDVSAEAIDHVTQLKQSHPELDNVQLQQAPADNFSAVTQQTYDTLIINSVIQHFPSIQYLTQVLGQAVTHVKDGGRIFIGDIRSFGLLKTYHASVQLYQADDDMRLSELNQQIDKQLSQEEELVVDPHFFSTLQTQYPQITHVEIYPKRGTFFNELTKFRFDVVLHIGHTPALYNVEWQDWQPQWDIHTIRSHLTQKQPTHFGLHMIENTRLLEENLLLQQLTQQAQYTIAEFRQQCDQSVGLNPEALYQLAQELGYELELSWLNTNEQGCFDGVFKQSHIEGSAKFAKPIVDNKPYANTPLQQSGIYQQSLITDIKRHLQAHLPDYMHPAHYVVLDEMPLTPNGKVDRKALLTMDIHANRNKQQIQAARDEIESKLVDIWQDILNVQPIGITDNFFELGGHSLLAIHLVSKIEQQFNQQLSLASLFEGATIEQLANILRKPDDQSSWQPVVKIQPRGDKPILYCIPGAGGNVLYYYELARALGQERPFYGLQSKGLNGIDKPLKTIEAIAAHHIQHLKQVQPTGTYYISGHSFGAYIAFEVARQLEQQGDTVGLVAILDLDASFYGDMSHPCHQWSDVDWIMEYTEAAKQMTGKQIQVDKRILLDLDSDDRYAYFKQQIEAVNILPPQTSIQQFIGYVDVFKSNTIAMMKYHEPVAQLQAKMALFKTNKGLQTDENAAILKQPTWGWQKFTQQTVSTYDISGDHISMISAPHVTTLAKQLNQALDQADSQIVI